MLILVSIFVLNSLFRSPLDFVFLFVYVLYGVVLDRVFVGWALGGFPIVLFSDSCVFVYAFLCFCVLDRLSCMYAYCIVGTLTE